MGHREYSIHALNLFSLEFAGTIHLYSILKTNTVHMKGRGCEAVKRLSSRLYGIHSQIPWYGMALGLLPNGLSPL
jgi:hypothetical protein